MTTIGRVALNGNRDVGSSEPLAREARGRGPLQFGGGACARRLEDAGPGSAGGAVSRRAPHGDAGSAVVEFVTLGLLLMLPLTYLVIAMGRLQAASFAADGSARAAARAFVTAPDDDAGRVRALAAVRLGLLDQGFQLDPRSVLSLDCSADPCLTPGGRVEVTVSVPVVLPGVPAVLDRAIPTRINVRAAQVAAVDAFREQLRSP